MKLKKIDIGCGDNPKEGYDGLDIRDIKSIKYPRTNARKLPVEDNAYDEVYSSHTIEHFGWRETKDVLIEWLRVLKPGGRLEIVLPDFYRLWKNLITQRDLPKSEKWGGGPVDSAFVAYVTGGGQDYHENTHLAHYTDKWYRKTLEELGCTVEIKYHGKDHPSPSIRIIAIKY